MQAATQGQGENERRRRVLVVDDDATQRKLLMVHLAQQALDVVGVANGAEALALARQEPPDAIVSDVLMPVLDGFGLCLAVRRDPQLRSVPVVLCSSSYDDELDGRLAVDVGANAFLSRVPGDMSQIIDVLMRSLELTPPALLRSAEELVHDHLDRALAQLDRQARSREDIERRYQALMEHAEEAIGMTDAQGVLFEVNRAFEQLTGRSREQLLGRPAFELVVPEERELQRKELATLLRTRQPRRRSTCLQHADGRRIDVELVSSLSEIDGEAIIIVAGHDVTERNRLEAQLRQTQKMDALGRLTGGIAHDFNNLMSVVLTNCDLLLEELRAEDPLVADVQAVRRAGERAATLTRQLTAFSRTQMMDAKVIGLNSAIVDVWKMIRRVIGEDVQLVTNLDPAVGHVCIDVAQLEQVLMNLVINARNAMPHGGALTLGTSNATLDEAAARRLGGRAGSWVRLSVEDQGVGMSPAVQTRIFEPFFTTREHAGGSGLGLSTVFGIVAQSGGFILVHSEVGEGARFDVYLPRVERPLDAGDARPPLPQTQRRYHVLLVEDDDMVRRSVARLLRLRGHEVLEASSLQEALASSAAATRPLDLLLTDMVLPGCNGALIADAVCARLPQIKVLFMSGFTDHAAVRQQLSRAGAQFIAKPFSLDALDRKLATLFEAAEG